MLHAEAGQYDDDEIPSLVAAAESWPLAHDTCTKLAESYLRRGLVLPGPLAEFVIEALNGERRRPTARGRSSETNYARDAAIAEAVAIALNADRSLRATRNEASEPGSACDLVAEKVAAYGIPLGYDRVRRIWAQADKRIARRE